MSRIWLMALMAALMLVPGPKVSAQAKAGSLSFASTVWDFGTIREDGGSVMHTFSFSNRSASAVSIERISVSCSCVKVYAGETSFGPGESGELTVTFAPDGLAGAQEKAVTILTDGPRVTLEIRGNVVNQRFDDSYSVDLGGGLRARTMDLDFGVIYPGERFLRALMLWNDSQKPVDVSAAGVPSSLRVLGGGVIPAGEKAELDVVYELPSSSARYGTLAESFRLNVNGAALPRAVSVKARSVGRTPRSASVKPRMELSSKELSLRRFFWQSQASGSLDIVNSGNGDLHILKVETEGVAECSLKGGMTLPAGKSARLGVTLPAASGTVVLFTDDPVRPYLEIPCSVR